MVRGTLINLTAIQKKVDSGDFVQAAKSASEWGGADVIISAHLNGRINNWLTDSPIGHIYNAHRAEPFRHHGIILVECPWAVMRLCQAGLPNAVSLLGTQLFKDQIDWLAKAPGILLLLDGDQAGRHASARIAKSLSSLTTVYTHLLPDNKEPEDLCDQALAAIVQKYPLSFVVVRDRESRSHGEGGQVIEML
jgi:5S rRNA maturation endonuclease (ribonuclease M5)